MLNLFVRWDNEDNVWKSFFLLKSNSVWWTRVVSLKAVIMCSTGVKKRLIKFVIWLT